MIDSTKKTVLLSGITSFLGYNLSRYLLENDYDVYGIIRKDSKSLDRINDIKDKIHVINIDFDKDDKNTYIDKIKDIKDKKITFIHMAWDSSSELGRYDEVLQEKNYYSSINALYLASILNTDKFIFTSSQAEDNDTPYGIYKKKFSIYGKENYKNFVHLRIFSIYGDSDYHNTLIKYLVACAKNKVVAKLGSCDYMWNYLHIEDFVKIIRCFIENEVDYSLSYDIASDDDRLLKDYIKYFIDKYDLQVEYNSNKKSEKFAKPDINNTKKVIGNDYQFIRFMNKYNI